MPVTSLMKHLRNLLSRDKTEVGSHFKMCFSCAFVRWKTNKSWLFGHIQHLESVPLTLTCRRFEWNFLRLLLNTPAPIKHVNTSLESVSHQLFCIHAIALLSSKHRSKLNSESCDSFISVLTLRKFKSGPLKSVRAKVARTTAFLPVSHLRPSLFITIVGGGA